MKTQIAFLRGINVGKIRIKMDDLTLCFEDLGLKGVKTFLQSGNVVFKSPKDSALLKSELEIALSKRFSYEAFVIMVDFESLPSIIANYPFARDEESHAYILFTSDQKTLNELCELAKSDKQPAYVFDSVLYLKMPKGETLSSPFSKTLAKPKYKSLTTMRNIQTLEKMASYQ